MIRNNKEVELYIHIPFCVKKCAYCDFLSAPATENTIEEYVDALIKEIEVCGRSVVQQISTVFIGGGTPSILTEEQISRIMKSLREHFILQDDAEITIEANPGTVTENKLMTYRQCGINRISFGLQSTVDKELQLLGRIHTFRQFVDNFKLARKCGFDNINVDLISAIPGQKRESWEQTLRDVIALSPEHISAYSLIIEEGTPFAKQYGPGCKGEAMLPCEVDEREMYHLTDVLLKEAGYHRYEISNYAKPGKECRHNLGYWERTPYLGLGLGAASLTEREVRYHNVTDLKTYMEHSANLHMLRTDIEELSETEAMEEFIFLGLRKMEGISLSEFEAAFGKTLQECYGKGIDKMTRQGFLEEKQGSLRLTQAGIDVSNQVFAEILYD